MFSRIPIVAEAGAENELRHRANSGARRHLREALGRDDRGDGDHRIVAEVKEKTRENRSGPGPCKREDNADESQEAHKAPGPSELCAVHEAKQGSSDNNADKSAEPDGAGRIGPSILRKARKFTGEERVQITAENRFFDQWSDENRHGHEQHGAGAALEELLNGNVIHVFDARAG